ncbi:DoxX family protein [Pseudaquabacterium terrae]|nr:DoxX family protein [Aquabacterium terrae]
MQGRELRRDFDDAGKLVLRLTVGVLVLLHGIAKVRHGLGGMPGMLQQAGLPGVLAYGAYIGEVLAPLLMIAGAWTRVSALLVAINMLFAIGLAHAHQIFTLGPQGGWAIELQGLMLFGAVAVALLGAGRFSIGRLMRGDGVVD